MRKMLAIAALATLTLGGCAMPGMHGEQRAFVPGIHAANPAQPIAEAGMWRMPSGLVIPMGYAPTDAAQEQLVLQHGMAAQPGGIVR